MGSMVNTMPGLSSSKCAGLAIVQDLGLFVEHLANAVAAKLANDGKAQALCKHLNGVANVTQVRTGFDFHNAMPHGVIGHLAQAFGGDRPFTHDEHAAGVAMPAVFDDGDVDVDDVALFSAALSLGMPWQTWWLIEVQMDLG